MSEEMFIGDYAPKQIWIDEHSEWWPTHSRSDTTPYIRADIVHELVKALKDIRDYEFSHRYIKDITEAALKKMEESHE